jgi:hypothetical protein
MSLVKSAIRICAVEAIKGKTFFAENVLDSQNDAFVRADTDQVGTSQEKPFISVYTEGSANSEPASPMGLHEDGEIELTIELGIAHAHLAEDEDGDIYVAVDLPATDANMEFQLDVAVRQIKDALLDPTSEWADLFRSFTTKLNKATTKRAGQGNSARLAARQLSLSYEVICDPACGEELPSDGPFAKFLAKLETHPKKEYNAMAASIRNVLGASDGFGTAQSTLGLSNEQQLALRGIGHDVAIPDDAGSIQSIAINDDAPIDA